MQEQAAADVSLFMYQTGVLWIIEQVCYMKIKRRLAKSIYYGSQYPISRRSGSRKGWARARGCRGEAMGLNWDAEVPGSGPRVPSLEGSPGDYAIVNDARTRLQNLIRSTAGV